MTARSSVCSYLYYIIALIVVVIPVFVVKNIEKSLSIASRPDYKQQVAIWELPKPKNVQPEKLLTLSEPSNPKTLPRSHPSVDPNNNNNNNNNNYNGSAAVRFVKMIDIDPIDYFSATWWQSKQRFLKKFRPESIRNVEGAVFTFIGPYKDDLRVTVDWMSFSVEHLSKVWKITAEQPNVLEIHSYNMFVDKLLAYTSRGVLVTSQGTVTTTRTKSSFFAMSRTLAAIAFMPYHENFNSTRGQTLTTANLVATLTSLIRWGCGRIVIVVDQEDYNDPRTPLIFTAAKHLLRSQISLDRSSLETAIISYSAKKTFHNQTRPHDNSQWEFQILATEVALVTVVCSSDNGTRSGKRRLVPKAALVSLRNAFTAQNQNNNSKESCSQWLGSRGEEYWKYVYLTEPDTILVAKEHALVALGKELDEGKIAAPWRLQPLPHQRDMPQRTRQVLPHQGKFAHIVDMTAADKCCDGGRSHPGVDLAPRCSLFWWTCGFRRSNPTDHSRLEHYQLLSLTDHGTGIVNLAGSEHARRCIPKTTNMSDYFSSC